MSTKISSLDAAKPIEAAQRGQAATAQQISSRNGLCFLVVHLLSLLALLPWFFSWTGVMLCIAGVYLVGLLGINVGYHRLLTHRGFSCPKWLERGLAVLGACCVQDSPAYWVAIHRRHHHSADEESDPHTPLFGLFWAHIGWLLIKSDDLERGPLIERYAKDIMRDPFHAWLHKSDMWMFIALASWALFFAAGFAAEVVAGAGATDAAQFGWSLVIWGGPVRTVVVWHQTWCVNSVTHTWGYRNYETADDSRNNVFVGILSNGEGWHNNHHADPRSARHGHKRWELDVSWLAIRLFMALGLAKDVATPSAALAESLQARAARAAERALGPRIMF